MRDQLLFFVGLVGIRRLELNFGRGVTADAARVGKVVVGDLPAVVVGRLAPMVISLLILLDNFRKGEEETYLGIS